MQPRGHIQIHGAVGAPAADDEVLLTAQQVCARLGGISAMTLWRWLGSEPLQFPEPTVRINKRRYWSAASIRQWLAGRQEKTAA
jgi:predicted DNA-binding transcriptional regulator AlpA